MANRFKELDNVYMNTGGHCMVDITSVYDSQDKRLLYVIAGNDWLTVSTYNFVQLEIPDNTEPEDFILYSMEMNYFTTEPAFDNSQMNDMPEDLFELFNHGLLSYIKNTFKYDHQLTKCTVESLPVELRRMVSDEYAKWLSDNELLVTTDGDQIIAEEEWAIGDYPNYKTAKALQKMLTEWMPKDVNTIGSASWEKFYDEKIQIIANGQVFTFDNGADIFNALEELAKFVISEQ